MARKVLHPVARECWEQFSSWDEDKWCGAWVATKEQLEDWVQRVYVDPVEMARIRNYKGSYEAFNLHLARRCGCRRYHYVPALADNPYPRWKYLLLS